MVAAVSATGKLILKGLSSSFGTGLATGGSTVPVWPQMASYGASLCSSEATLALGKQLRINIDI